MATEQAQHETEWDAAAYERTANPRFGWSPLRAHLTRLKDPSLQSLFLDLLTQQGARDEPPFGLDLRLLNLAARRPG